MRGTRRGNYLLKRSGRHGRFASSPTARLCSSWKKHGGGDLHWQRGETRQPEAKARISGIDARAAAGRRRSGSKALSSRSATRDSLGVQNWWPSRTASAGNVRSETEGGASCPFSRVEVIATPSATEPIPLAGAAMPHGLHRIAARPAPCPMRSDPLACPNVQLVRQHNAPGGHAASVRHRPGPRSPGKLRRAVRHLSRWAGGDRLDRG